MIVDPAGRPHHIAIPHAGVCCPCRGLYPPQGNDTALDPHTSGEGQSCVIHKMHTPLSGMLAITTVRRLVVALLG